MDENKIVKAELTKAALLDNPKATEMYVRCHDNIKKEYTKVDKVYLSVAANLYLIYKDKLFMLADYKNIYDYSKSEFGMARGTTGDLINIIKRFGNKETGKLLPEYKDYNFSQLNAMRKLDDDAIKLLEFNPEMSRDEIKEIISEFNGEPDEKEEKAGREGRHATEPKDDKVRTYKLHNTSALLNDDFIAELTDALANGYTIKMVLTSSADEQ